MMFWFCAYYTNYAGHIPPGTECMTCPCLKIQCSALCYFHWVTLLYCSMPADYLPPWLPTTLLHFGSIPWRMSQSLLPQLHNTSHKISQCCHSLYILQIYPLIDDIYLRLDFEISKMTVLAVIFRNEPCFPSVSKRYCWRVHSAQLNQKALRGLLVHYVWRLDVFHNHF